MVGRMRIVVVVKTFNVFKTRKLYFLNGMKSLPIDFPKFQVLEKTSVTELS